MEFLMSMWASIPLLIKGLGAVIVVFMAIPGEQPEKFLQGLVDLLSKFSAGKKGSR